MNSLPAGPPAAVTRRDERSPCLTREVYDVSGGRSERYILNKLSLSDQDGYVPHICTTGHGRTRAPTAERQRAVTKKNRATNPALSLSRGENYGSAARASPHAAVSKNQDACDMLSSAG